VEHTTQYASLLLTLVQHDPYEIHNLYPLNQLSQQKVLHFTPTLPTHEPTQDNLAFTFPPNNTTAATTSSTTFTHLLPRLDALLAVLKTCKGRACTHPWSVLHPANDVSDLHDALDARFDEYYEVRLQDQRVHFTKCEKGYIAESEGPDGIEPLGMMVDEVAF